MFLFSKKEKDDEVIMYKNAQLQLFKKAIKLHREDLLKNSDELAKNQVNVVDSAYQSIITKGGKAYFSTPITTGARLYEVCKERKIKNLEDLNEFRSNKTDFYNEVIKVNIDNSLASANSVAKEYDGCLIAPAIFEAKKLRWSQAEYMNMWLGIIDRDITDIYGESGFAYSDGAVMEMTHAALMKMGYADRSNINLKIKDGTDLTLIDLIEKILDATTYISAFTPPITHAEALYKLRCAMCFTEIENVQEVFGGDLQSYQNIFKEVEHWLRTNTNLLKELHSSFNIFYDLNITSSIKKQQALLRPLNEHVTLKVVEK